MGERQDGSHIALPRHGNRDLKLGTLLRIIRNLGISKKELDDA